MEQFVNSIINKYYCNSNIFRDSTLMLLNNGSFTIPDTVITMKTIDYTIDIESIRTMLAPYEMYHGVVVTNDNNFLEFNFYKFYVFLTLIDEIYNNGPKLLKMSECSSLFYKYLFEIKYYPIEIKSKITSAAIQLLYNFIVNDNKISLNFNVTNCYNTLFCVHCNDCSDCIYCISCNNCINSVNCEKCNNCVKVKNSNNCVDCNEIINCNYCKLCIKIKNVNYKINGEEIYKINKKLKTTVCLYCNRCNAIFNSITVNNDPNNYYSDILVCNKCKDSYLKSLTTDLFI